MLKNHFSLKIRYKSDIRTKEVANFVSSIDTLKSTALDNIMVKIIESLRRKELRLILLLTMILSPIPACRNILSRFGILIVIIVFHKAYSRLPSSASIFSLISAIRELDSGLLNDSQNAFASINKLLAFDSRIKPIIYKEAIEKKFHRLQSEIKYSLEMKAVCAAWDDDEKYIFDLTVSKNEFVVITGENGNGKAKICFFMRKTLVELAIVGRTGCGAAATNAVNMLVSFEQMADFLTLKPNENQLSEKESVDPSWPTDGDLHVEKVSFKYSLNKEYVLRNISFNVSPRSKLAIVGRTGSGKSSILNMIERMGIVEGIVILDGVDTSLLNLRELRRRICIIPQKPIFISGTLRDNLDTFKEVSDEYIWTILKSVQMDEVIKRIVGDEGLDGFVRGSGFEEHFSFGQLQLLSMARAIIRKRKLVIMDEATSNLEAETEKIIQRVIRHEFSECTVITIAHHIKTIIDYDDVMVSDFFVDEVCNVSVKLKANLILLINMDCLLLKNKM
ncbi:hypothetical protein ACOME3_002840 [Neoechinorhynchus agilis]